MKKLTFAAALLLCLSLCMTACSSFRDDVPVSDLTTAVFGAVATQGGFTAADADYVSLEFGNPDVISQNVSEWMICASTSSQTVDEFGIFHVKDGADLDAVKQEIWDYMEATKIKLEVYLEMYEPSEKDKLYNSQLTICGNYIIYTFLTDADTTACTTAVKDALSGK